MRSTLTWWVMAGGVLTVSASVPARWSRCPTGEAWLVLPTWQLAATGSVSTAPQRVVPAPIRLVLDDRTGPPDDGADGDGDFVRERDDLVASAYWNGTRGRLIGPPATPPSRQAQARSAVQDALTNLARFSSKHSFRSP